MTQENQESYQVLARKYRPQNFEQLVGQDVLVQTLKNSIEHKKIAHAFILTGIRGVGKTTSARIIAKSLNCIGEDGTATQPQFPCNKCKNCEAIGKSSFQDVIEIDAASRTGVDDMRSIIDSISYAPAIGRYKVYIIDEVHMLSNSAFNALLKTLEEPPAHTKFIFATTEIKKIPVTVLSRCQRFDLRRLNDEELKNYLAQILEKEGFEADKRALSLIANCAQGSVRDALSITDRALSCNNYEKTLNAQIVEELTSATDKSLILELLEALLEGNVQDCLDKFTNFYAKSSDVASLVQDLLEITHKITLNKSIKNSNLNDFSTNQIEKIKEISEKNSLVDLARLWQILLKGLNEVNFSSTNQKIIFEMLLIRICHLSDLPNFENAIKKAGNTQVTIAQDQSINQNNNDKKPDFSGEVLRNFSNSKVVQ